MVSMVGLSRVLRRLENTSRSEMLSSPHLRIGKEREGGKLSDTAQHKLSKTVDSSGVSPPGFERGPF